VSRLYAVDVEILVTEDGAADGNEADGAILNAELFDDLCYETVNDTVAAAGAVVHDGIRKNGSFLKYSIHCFTPPSS
jgi:hypothetical protein